jgi:dihydroorotate dehydrogenase (fumarate)
MDLSTTYLGLKLPHPLMPGAGPLADELDTVKRLEDAGAAAIVLRSLFEEQIAAEQLGALRHMHAQEGTSAEALTFFPSSDIFALGPQEYLEQIRKIRATVNLPVIASLNGTTRGGWIDYATLMESAGASAIELNLYAIATDPRESATALEGRLIGVVEAVCKRVRVPIAVKLSPFFSALPHFAQRLEAAGAAGVILFNRFYQADLDIEALEVRRALALSTPQELLLRLRWLAILSGRTKMSLAASGGVHDAEGAIKSVMAGAHAVQLVSTLLQHGPEHLRRMRETIETWLEAHEYESLEQARGSMGLDKCPDPYAYERANYAAILQSWRPR